MKNNLSYKVFSRNGKVLDKPETHFFKKGRAPKKNMGFIALNDGYNSHQRW